MKEDLRTIRISDLTLPELRGMSTAEPPGMRQQPMLILPNSFTFSYKAENFTACQHDILILIFEKLQGFMTTGCPLDKELCSEQKVTIDCSEIMDIRHKEHVIQAALGLRDLQFGFRYIRDELGNVNRVWGVFVTTVEDIRDTSFIRLTINRDIFPVLTYYGESVGGTFLLKGPALETKGRHTKTIRNMLISRKGLGQFRTDLDEFKLMLGLSTKYRPSCLRKDILEPVRRWLLENSDIWFEYEIQREKVPGRKARSNAIFIWIYTRGKDAFRRDYGDYSTVYNSLVMASRKPDLGVVQFVDRICESGRLHFAASKCRYYGGLVRSGEMDRAHAVNIVRKIMLEDFSIDLP